jgi:hypothetical protein
MPQIKRWTEKRPFSLYVDDAGFAQGIACKGQVVLHLQAGTEINGACLPTILDLLNEMPQPAVAEILNARRIYDAGRQNRKGDGA